jgi:hypothetical protein
MHGAAAALSVLADADPASSDLLYSITNAMDALVQQQLMGKWPQNLLSTSFKSIPALCHLLLC